MTWIAATGVFDPLFIDQIADKMPKMAMIKMMYLRFMVFLAC